MIFIPLQQTFTINLCLYQNQSLLFFCFYLNLKELYKCLIDRAFICIFASCQEVVKVNGGEKCQKGKTDYSSIFQVSYCPVSKKYFREVQMKQANNPKTEPLERVRKQYVKPEIGVIEMESDIKQRKCNDVFLKHHYDS